MRSSRHISVVGGILVVCSAMLQAGQQAAGSDVQLAPDEMERFLREGRIVSMRSAGDGVTNSRRARLTSGTVTHDAHVQIVDIKQDRFDAGVKSELNFRDSYRYNIAAYRVSRLLGLDHVPMSVHRVVDGLDAAVTWWVDDVMMDERERTKRGTTDPDPQRYSKQIQVMRVFDVLIQNRDRNRGNLLWTSTWKMWLIDHTRAFRLEQDVKKDLDTLARVERAMFERLRSLTAEAVTEAVGSALTRLEIAALMARRDLMVAHFEARIAERGEAAVLFAMQ